KNFGSVATHVVGEFCLPKGSITSRHSRTMTTCVMVPKTAIHEDRPLSFFIGEIGCARKIPRSATVPPTKFSEHFGYPLFGRRPNALNALHQSASDRIGLQLWSRQAHSAAVEAALSRLCMR